MLVMHASHGACLCMHAATMHSDRPESSQILNTWNNSRHDAKFAAPEASDTAVSRHLTDRQLGTPALHHVIQAQEMTAMQTKYECATAER